MRDAAELAQAIAAHPDDLDAALAQYEPAMFERTAKVAESSAEVAKMMSGPDAAQKVLAFFS